MGGLRDLVTAAALLGLTGVSLAALTQIARQGLHTAEPAREREFSQWLTQHDLAAESQQTRLSLVRQMERDLQQGELRPTDASALTPDERKRLESNLAQLLQIWILERVDRYFYLPPDQRTAYLDREIETLDRLRQQLSPAASDDPLRPQGEFDDLLAWGAVLGQMQTWIDQAEPEEQARIREFQRAVQSRILVRQIEAGALRFSQP